jgi:hypothetical protein
VVAAGAGAALVAACSSEPKACGGLCGFAFMPSDATDGSDDAADQPDAVFVGVAPCADGGCGLMSNPDAGDGGDADTAVDADAEVDAGTDSGAMGVIDSGPD